MTRGILIVGNESPLLSAVSAEAAKLVEQYAIAPIPRPEAGALAGGVLASGALAGGEDKKIALDWTPGSPISARVLMLAAENRLGRIDDAILVCSPPTLLRPPEAVAPMEIETLVDDQIKCWFFLVRELALYFRGRNGGALVMIASELAEAPARDGAGDFMGAPAAASFRALGQGLLASSAAEPFRIMGFSAAEPGAESDFAAWCFKLLDDSGKRNSGRWHKYGKLGGFFTKRG